MQLPSPVAFAISIDGASIGYTYCLTGANCTGQHYDAISYCQSASKGVPCKLYAIGKSVVWQGNTSLVPGEGVTPTPTPSLHPAAAVRPIAVTWEGFEELFAGTATTNEKADGGTISIVLPGGKGTCQGSYIINRSGQGSWAVNCTNGLAATGQFQGQGPNKGSVGQGVDGAGRAVKFTIGPKVG